MVYSGAYAFVLVLHLLTVVFLVGPAALAAMTSPRLVRTGNVAGLRDAARTTRGYTLGTVLTVLVGAALVGLSGSGTQQWSMGSLWVSASFALWFVALVLTLVVVVPAQTSAADALEAGQDASAAASRVAAAGGAAMLCWILIIVLMVLKPGA